MLPGAAEAGLRRWRWRLLMLLVLLPPFWPWVRGIAADGELALVADNNCRSLKIMDMVRSSEPACFCYLPNKSIHLKNIWSTIQVKICSIGLVEVVSISEESDCHQSENLFAFLKCLLNNIWQPRVAKEIILSVDYYGDETCFRVQPTNKMPYAVNVQQNMLDQKLLLLFVAGGLLFHFAHNLSRSVIFYYSAGVALGVFATLVFLLLMLKRFIPKLSTFWILMSGSCFCSVYVFYTWKEYLKLLWYNSTHHVLGYVLVVGLLSFAICYKHGTLHSEQSMDLVMWLLQLLSLVFIYFGIAIPHVAYVAIGAMLCSKILHHLLQVFCFVGSFVCDQTGIQPTVILGMAGLVHSFFWPSRNVISTLSSLFSLLRRKAFRLFKSEEIKVRHLTEDEFREQGERETARALEELRTFCRRPEFPSWVAVVKLQSPQKFAHFVLGLPHVSPEEITAHDEQYGLGGALLEEQLFNAGNETDPDPPAGLTEEEGNCEDEGERPRSSFHFHSQEFL